jgi:DNA-binding MarR family transcriptional regulator
MQARIRLPSLLEVLTKRELIRAIEESALSRTDEKIAKRRLVEKCEIIDIACELGYERSTISKRLKRIILRVEEIAERIYT